MKKLNAKFLPARVNMTTDQNGKGAHKEKGISRSFSQKKFPLTDKLCSNMTAAARKT